MRQEIALVMTNTKIAPEVHLISLEAPQIAVQAQPGQFVMVRCGEDTLLRRPLSLHRVEGKNISLLIGVVGKGTYWLSQLREGESLDILGPLGNGFKFNPNAKNLLLIAGGIGIAPLLFLAEKSKKLGHSVTLLLGAKTASELYPKELIPSETKLIITTEDGSAGKKGMITDLLPDFIDWADQVFACGPMSMYQAISTLTKKFPKLKSAQVSLEVRMGCGLGVCYGCTIKTRAGLRQVCKDGPIFELGDITWEEPWLPTLLPSRILF